MDERLWLAERFEEHRPRLRAIAFRMLGSVSEADDVLQETWLRVTRADPSAVENMAGWLTTIVARMALNQLRSRRRRREERFADSLPEPIIDRPDGIDPEHAAVLADSVGLAMLVVLETLTPAERLAFVLHDTFGVPFDDIAPIVDRTPTAARQLASRARRRIRSQPIVPDTDLRRQREVVDAFQAAARDGDFEGLVRVLDPEAVVRADWGPGHPRSGEIRGAREVARQALDYARALGGREQPALVNGGAGLVVLVGGRLWAVMGFTVNYGRIVEIDILRDPVRLQRLSMPSLGG
jgi:RNA polymerase sigma factor (sigma-70 family)